MTKVNWDEYSTTKPAQDEEVDWSQYETAPPIRAEHITEKVAGFFKRSAQSVADTARSVFEPSQTILDRARPVEAGSVEASPGYVPVPNIPAPFDMRSASAQVFAEDAAAKAIESREAADRRAARQRVAAANPLTSAAVAGTGGFLAGLGNAPAAGAQYFNEVAANPLLKAAGFESLKRVSDMPGVAAAMEASEHLMPEVGKGGLEKAWDDSKFAEWLSTNLSAQAPQFALSAAGMLSTGARKIVLPVMAAAAAGSAYARGDSGSAAVSKGLIEGVTEMLPLGVFDKVKDMVLALPRASRGLVVAEATRRMVARGAALTASAITESIEEVAAQVAGNAVDKYGQGKDKVGLMDGTLDAAVLGAAAGVGHGALHARSVMARGTERDQAERDIAREIDGGQFAPVGNIFANTNPNLAQGPTTYTDPITEAAGFAPIVVAPSAPAPVDLTTLPPLEAAPASVDHTAALLEHANERDRQLTLAATGSKATSAVDEAGNTVGTPAVAKRFLTPAEKEEQAFLNEHGGDAPKLAARYPELAAPARTTSIDAGTADDFAQMHGEIQRAEGGAPAVSPATAGAQSALDRLATAQITGIQAAQGVTNATPLDAGQATGLGQGNSPVVDAGDSLQRATPKGGVGAPAAPLALAPVAPKVGVSPATLARDIAAIQDSRLKRGEVTSLQAVATTDGLSEDAQIAVRIADQLGAPIVFLRDANGRAKFNGAQIDGTVYINVDSSSPISAVVTHEVGHAMPADIKQTMIQGLRDLEGDTWDANLGNFLKDYPNYATSAPEVQHEEMAMRVLEQNMQDKGFLAKLRDRMGDTPFGKLMEHMVASLDRVLAGFPRVNSAQYVSKKNIESAREVMAEALAETQRRQGPIVVAGKDAPVIQNRDRSAPGSIQQMNAIAAAPDYGRLGFSRDFASGAPVVTGGEINPLHRGRRDVAVGSDGRRIDVQYAVVEAADVLASHGVDGSSNIGYDKASSRRIKAIAGNGRVAGLTASYGSGKAANYKQELLEDDLHGVNRSVIERMKTPVLVRIMAAADVTADIGDVSNTTGALELGAVEQARNDAKRVDVGKLEFGPDGQISQDAVRRFVQSMPISEQGGMIDRGGAPARRAVDRLTAAVFAQAYNNDELIRLFAQAQDSEARAIMGALAQASVSMSRLNGAGALDIRDIVIQAAEVAINARRSGQSLLRASQQFDITNDPDVMVVLKLFANNVRSPRLVAQALRRAADFAYHEANKDAEDMFGDVPKATRADVVKKIEDSANETGGTQEVGDTSGRESTAGHADGRGPDARERANAGGVEEPGASYGPRGSGAGVREGQDDLFTDGGEDIFGLQRGPGFRGVPSRPSTLSDTVAPPGDYEVNTFVGSEVQRVLGVTRIRTPGDAAAATRYLYQSAVERFDGIVVDKDGKPLAVIGGFKSGVAQASIFPATLMGEAVRIPGAAAVWFSHNHPSGHSALSPADVSLARSLDGVFRGTNVQPMGLLAIGGGRYSMVDGAGVTREDNSLIPRGDGSTAVPVIERRIHEGARGGAVMDGPEGAKRLAKSYYAKSKAPGMVLLGTQLNVLGWVPLSSEALGKLRGTGGLTSLYRAISQTNASAVVLVHGGNDLNQLLIGSPDGIDAAENITRALRVIDVKVLDSINGVNGESEAERGLAPRGNGLAFSEQAKGDQTETPEFKTWYGDWAQGAGHDASARGYDDGRGGEDVNALQRRGGVDAHPAMGSRLTVGDVTFPGAAGPVGKNGAPLVVFHGTRDDVAAFDLNHANRKDSGWLGRGVYASSSADLASLYAEQKRGHGGQAVMPLFMAVQRPYVATLATKLKLKNASQATIDAFTDGLKAMGHDGVVMAFPDGHVELVAFEPTRVKSAIGNNGNFDGDDRRIDYSDEAIKSAKPARAMTKPTKNLIAIHNITEDGLMYAQKLGGLPVPSIGVTKSETAFTDFGDITMIARKGLIDPERVPVYDRDAYTSRFPELNFKPVKALSDARSTTSKAIRLALQKNKFRGIDNEDIDAAREAIMALRSASTDYFEAKPQRAVALSEFAGAVVPVGVSEESRAILNAAGVVIVDYTKKEGDREAKVLKLAKRLDKAFGDVMFSESASDQPLLAPNGRPSKLTPGQYAAVRTKEFKAWFGDWEKFAQAGRSVWQDDKLEVSKAVDAETGEPLVLYHGSDSAGFAEFNYPGGERRGDLGIFMADNRSVARTYIKRLATAFTADDLGADDSFSGIYGLFANIRRPAEEHFEGANWDGTAPYDTFEVVDEYGDPAYNEDGGRFMNRDDAARLAEKLSGEVQPASDHYTSTDGVVQEARRGGMDGAIIHDVVDDGGGGGYGDPVNVYVAFKPGQLKSADFNSGEFGRDTDDIRFSDAPKTPLGFFSALARNVADFKASALPASAWRDAVKGFINKGAVKADEVEWTGINDWLALQSGKVTRAQVSEFLAGNGVQVTETVLSRDGKPNNDEWEPDDGKIGNTRYGNYTLPGGTNYREVLLTLPTSGVVAYTEDNVVPIDGSDEAPDPFRFWYFRAPDQTYQILKSKFERRSDALEYILREKKPELPASKNYKSSHFDQPNILAHIRVNDRTDADGKKVLFVEEVQSDFGQSFKKQRDAIGKAVDEDFMGIVERMKKDGVLTVECD